MKKLLSALFAMVLATGCATTTQPINEMELLAQALDISPTKNISLWNIPSRGAIADAASISTNGGGAADQLSAVMQQIGQKGAGTLILTSKNPKLPLAHLEGALENLDSVPAELFLIYAGNESNYASIKQTFDAYNIAHGFINLGK
uniref:hypothetical protein n=1 Tax=Thaumasiovibrio occultus TaxID=1891184 RepID=UPI000B363325|nr:hypothetical protein [Thaumasiovibrio occultus]